MKKILAIDQDSCKIALSLIDTEKGMTTIQLSQDNVDNLISHFTSVSRNKYESYSYAAGYLESAIKSLLSCRNNAEFQNEKKAFVECLIQQIQRME